MCGPPAAGTARCHAQQVTRGSGGPLATTSYTSGYRPTDLASAYSYSVPPAGTAWAWNGQTVAIVDAFDNPSTGVAVYDSYGSTGGASWLVFGGTSVASPVIAGIYALAGNATTVGYGSYPYTHTASLNDVTSGSNGRCRRTPYLCNAGPGYDGPTGLGTPKGPAGL